MSWGAVFSAVLQGVASRSAGKKKEKTTKEDRRQGLLDLAYAAEIQDYLKQKDRNYTAAAWDNFYNPDGKPGREPAKAPGISDYLQENYKGP